MGCLAEEPLLHLWEELLLGPPGACRRLLLPAWLAGVTRLCEPHLLATAQAARGEPAARALVEEVW